MEKREVKIIFPNGKKSEPIITDSVPSYENHPFFVKKAADAKAFLEKHPIPPHLIIKKS